METQSNKWLKLKRRLKELIAAVAASHHPMKVVKVIMIVAAVAVRKTMIVRMTMKTKITMRIKMISQQEMMLITIRIKLMVNHEINHLILQLNVVHVSSHQLYNQISIYVLFVILRHQYSIL
jgi:hypothetical protein